jgi:hypothetical protein
MSRLPLVAALAISVLGSPALAQTPPAPALPADGSELPVQLQEPATPRTAQAMTRYDTDEDGRLSRAEWISAGRQERGFARFDVDADGYLVEAELKTVVEMLAQRRGRQE